jgi:hypothetical protein
MAITDWQTIPLPITTTGTATHRADVVAGTATTLAVGPVYPPPRR